MHSIKMGDIFNKIETSSIYLTLQTAISCTRAVMRHSDADNRAILLAYNAAVAYPRSTFNVMGSRLASRCRHRHGLDLHRAHTRPT